MNVCEYCDVNFIVLYYIFYNLYNILWILFISSSAVNIYILQLLSMQAKSISGKPVGPWRSVEALSVLSTSVFSECSTVDEQFVRAVQLFPTSKCLGTRELLREEEEQQPNGRMFKKVISCFFWLLFGGFQVRQAHHYGAFNE